ncbi:olfactory receptor 4E1-like [Coregonus clupeaformis]|uniref:olfactory receptor 4E1-like n=1 Tax=Coregonus clupeaformis TaxID=59861 RepID=UPI001E1C764C|nr:olfactory receptor 4E1-like [Coregonus clupeaformis]
MTIEFNSSHEIVFVLHGLNMTQTYKHIYFSFTLILYLFTIVVNLTLIVTIFLEKMLHDPMYLFLCNLCINDICGASAFYPKILYDLLFESHVITYIGCMTQIFVIYSYVFCEFTSLTVMAYDRYVAICKPLQYHSIMTTRKVWTLLLLTWLFSWLESSIGIGITARLPLCGLDIDKLYCSNWAVVKLSCIDTTLNNLYGFIITFSHISQTILILISYVNIIKASLRSRVERKKFMQTCLPHLITLTNFTISITFDVIYARYGSNTSLLALRNIMAVEFLIVPPLVNPIIYGMKLTQIRNRVGQMFNRKVADLT